MLEPRTVAYSSVRDQVHMVFPNDLNSNNTVFGGLILAQLDRIAAVVADRHAGGVCVTVGVDAVQFMAPARGGDVLIFSAAVNRAWTSSMEVGCKVEAERIGGGDRRHIRRRTSRSSRWATTAGRAPCRRCSRSRRRRSSATRKPTCAAATG